MEHMFQAFLNICVDGCVFVERTTSGTARGHGVDAVEQHLVADDLREICAQALLGVAIYDVG